MSFEKYERKFSILTNILKFFAITPIKTQNKTKFQKFFIKLHSICFKLYYTLAVYAIKLTYPELHSSDTNITTFMTVFIGNLGIILTSIIVIFFSFKHSNNEKCLLQMYRDILDQLILDDGQKNAIDWNIVIRFTIPYLTMIICVLILAIQTTIYSGFQNIWLIAVAMLLNHMKAYQFVMHVEIGNFIATNIIENQKKMFDINEIVVVRHEIKRDVFERTCLKILAKQYRELCKINESINEIFGSSLVVLSLQSLNDCMSNVYWALLLFTKGLDGKTKWCKFFRKINFLNAKFLL